MTGVVVSLGIVAVMVRLLLKGCQPQFVLFSGGFALLFISIVFLGVVPSGILPQGGGGTGLSLFDPFDAMRVLMTNRVAGLGLVIMAAGGFARYMSGIGASRAMVDVMVRPLRFIRSPYVVLGAAFLIGQLLKMFIPSASGLGMLLMVTVFPTLLRLGLSPLSATAAIACTGGIDFGPADGQSIFAARVAGIEPMEYFMAVLPVISVSVAVIAVTLVLVQRHMDQKSGHSIAEGLSTLPQLTGLETPKAPLFYMVLPALPLVLLLTFSPYGISHVSLGVVPAMLISVFVALVFELVRFRGDMRRVSTQLMLFFEGMGLQFTNVVTLIVAGELFAQGLKAIGSIDALINAVQHAGFSGVATVLIMTAFIGSISFFMGSGSAAFFSFAALVPQMAAAIGVTKLSMVMPMQFAAGIGCVMSPICGAIVAEAGIAGVSPFNLARRIFIPLLMGMISTTTMSIIVAW